MLPLNENDKKRITQFILEQDLDLMELDNPISGKFSVSASDRITFFIYNNNESYLIVKYDQEKEKQNRQAYEYFHFQNIPQVLEQLSLYDNSIPKRYWSHTTESVQIGFDAQNYQVDWYKQFQKDENWRVEQDGDYHILVYENSDYKPQLTSPFNTLHEVSLIDSKQYTKVDKLYFEIHPVSLKERNETFYLKLECNNDEKFKEYINYNISKKKGLKLFLEDLFLNMERFKLS
jgi:hypothetical protein